MTEPIIALIPARSGSKRVPRKNTRALNGHPLLAYAIATALESEIFSAVAVSSDDYETLELAERYGASHLILRPEPFAQDDSPDIDWVRHAMGMVGDHFDAFCILRPTSPFRRGSWVRLAYNAWMSSRADSLRAMRPVTEHAGKMWRVVGRTAVPLLPFATDIAPWHSSPTQSLPALYVQTAALEIADVEVLHRNPPSIAGSTVLPLICGAEDVEAIDINTELDWQRAELLATVFPDALPPVKESVPA